MERSDTIREHDKQNGEYAKQVLEWKWYGYNILFGMCSELVSPNQHLLYIGIGNVKEV